MVIRRATRHDVAAIVRIEKRSFGDQAWEREAFLDYLGDNEDCVFLVAGKDGGIAGYIIGFGAGKSAEVDSIAVSPPHRGQGIATALMNRLKRILRRRGIATLRLTVRLDNTAAIDLYRKLGFVRVRRINGYYEDGAPAWRMSASLTRPCRLSRAPSAGPVCS